MPYERLMPPTMLTTTDKPRLRPRHRWLQYSLRSLLVAMTLVCVALAAGYHYLEPLLVDAAVAKRLAEAGGSYESVPVGPDFLRTWFGDDVLHRVTSVNLPQPEVTAECLSDVTRLRWLEKAVLTGAAFGDDHLDKIARGERLRELTLRGTTVTDARVAEVRAARPELRLTVKPLGISFEDLHFIVPKGESFSRSHLTPRIAALDGSPVRIGGFILPSLQQFGLRKFVLVHDNVLMK